MKEREREIELWSAWIGSITMLSEYVCVRDIVFLSFQWNESRYRMIAKEVEIEEATMGQIKRDWIQKNNMFVSIFYVYSLFTNSLTLFKNNNTQTYNHLYTKAHLRPLLLFFFALILFSITQSHWHTHTNTKVACTHKCSWTFLLELNER